MITPLRRKLLTQLLRAFDLVMLTAAYVAAVAFALGVSSASAASAFVHGGVTGHALFTYAICLTSWNVCYNICGLEHSRRLANLWQDLKDLFVATVLMTV